MDNIINKLKYWLNSKEKLFVDFKRYVLDWENPDKHRIFIDRKSDVLFIAHIDTVQKPKFIRKTKNRWYAQGLDDRLGCMLASELSKELNVDLLICDLEESAKSTGQYHDLKDYNWIVEFDRAGEDVVTYDLDCDRFRQAIDKHFTMGFGSFSDICQLNTDVCCMNVGIGYKLAHSKDSYVNLKTMRKQIEKFREFYQENKGIKYVQDYKPDRYTWIDDSIDYSQGECEICGLINKVDYIYGHIICEDCFEDMYEQYYSTIWK